MVTERNIMRKEYRLNKEDIKKFKEMFGIKGTLDKFKVLTRAEYTTEEEYLDVICIEG